MHFNVDRIAVLAGLESKSGSGLMKEAAEPPAKAPVSPKMPPRPGPPAPPMKKGLPKPAAPSAKGAMPPMDELYMDEMYDEGMYDEGMYEMGMHDKGMHDKGMHDETVYEVDEEELMEALVDMREKRLNESKIRSAVRQELSDILNEMESGSRWIYGDKKPANSSKGKVSRGFLGPGFR
jgi:hypothetical protein